LFGFLSKVRNLTQIRIGSFQALYSKFTNIKLPPNLVDFHRCSKVKGDSDEAEVCQYFKSVYQSMCPNAWVDKWDSQREAGTFPGKI
jgi:phosphoenolpyruvate carboxylase